MHHDVKKVYVFLRKSHNNKRSAFGALENPYARVTFLRVKIGNGAVLTRKLMIFEGAETHHAWGRQQ